MTSTLDRSALVADTSLTGSAWCHAYAALVDEWVAKLFAEECGAPAGVSLVAVGGYGRAELSPASDVNVYFTNEFLSQAPYLPK